MDTKTIILAIFGTVLFINSIFCVPVLNQQVRHRVTRQTEDADSDEVDDNSSEEDIADRVAEIADSSSTLIADLLLTLESTAKIIRDILEAKRRIAEPILEGTARALETLSESKALERTLDTVQIVATAGIQASTGLTTALSRAGDSATPRLVQGITSVSEIGGRVVRLAICTLICPLQTGDERDTCRKDNCGKIDKSDNLDYYDGDYYEEDESLESDDI